MSKTEVVRARMEPEVKHHAEAIFRELGLSTTEAITIFYRQVSLCNGFPFDIRIPNEETLKTFENTDKGIGLTRYDTMEEMFDDLDKD